MSGSPRPLAPALRLTDGFGNWTTANSPLQIGRTTFVLEPVSPAEAADPATSPVTARPQP